MREGLEPATRCLEDSCSILLSYPIILRKQKDSNLRDLSVRHVSGVLV